MATIFNAESVSYKLRQSPIPEFSWHTSENLAEQVNAKHMQFQIRSLDPGKYSYPYHFHRNAEEMFVILEGSSLLRTPEGVKEIAKGDVVFFEMGQTGAHQLFNHTDQPCVYLDLASLPELDVAEYPDSGKIKILPSQDDVFQGGDRVDYYDGEASVAEKWEALKLSRGHDGEKKNEQQ
ncbi:cupin domain-containing protein [Gorillibacterium massiliense]|uniref:cupin domain-containing protein n=1 Tax=Gorillibacterium massiliense TaxID=1280390 RepID=UPI0004BC6BAC|nr:cupin domain-containing protein [Gorillibacterium massiliense]